MERIAELLDPHAGSETWVRFQSHGKIMLQKAVSLVECSYQITVNKVANSIHVWRSCS